MRLRDGLPVFWLLATSALATPALAQLRGAVGQAAPEYSVPVPAASAPASQGPMLPTLEDELRANEARRKARLQARAVTSAGNPVLDPKARGQVIRPTRAAIALSRPPNKAVPLRPQPAAGATTGALPDVIAPGLTEQQMQRRRRVAEDDPYAPLGIRVGGLILRPAIEANVGYDTNPTRAASQARPKGSMLYQVAPELTVQSDWSRHQLQLDLRGTYNYYPTASNANRPTLDARLSFRGDMGEQGTLNAELRERIDSQRPGSPDLTSAVKGRPLTFQTGASLGYTQRFGAAALTATGTVDRYDFEDGKTTSGLVVSQKDRAFTQYGVKLRGAYEVTPGIAPYVEVGADRRIYDLKVDAAGYERSSHGLTAKAGSTFELTRTLTGDISAGYGMRDYTDGRLAKLSGALVDASLVWRASPLTTYTIRAGSDFLETTTAGSSGAIQRRIGMMVTHELWRNLTITNSLDYTHASYNGVARTDQTFVAGLRFDYKFDRSFVFRTSYAFEKAISSLPGNSSTAHVFLAGIRVQR